MINATADEKTVKACMDFLNMLYTDEALANYLTYGIEGKHYELIDGRVNKLPDVGYTSNGVWAITAFNAPTLLVGENENKGKLYIEFNEAGVLSCTAGFFFDSTPVSAEVSAVDAAVNEYKTLLDKGFYNPDEYLPKMLEAMKKAGLEKVMTEMQSQYDAWLANK